MCRFSLLIVLFLSITSVQCSESKVITETNSKIATSSTIGLAEIKKFVLNKTWAQRKTLYPTFRLSFQKDDTVLAEYFTSKKEVERIQYSYQVLSLDKIQINYSTPLIIRRNGDEIELTCNCPVADPPMLGLYSELKSKDH